MESLKKLFPRSFGITDVAKLIISILIYLVIGAVAGVLLVVLAFIPIVNLVVGIVGTLVEIYVFAGIVIAVLDFLKVLK